MRDSLINSLFESTKDALYKSEEAEKKEIKESEMRKRSCFDAARAYARSRNAEEVFEIALKFQRNPFNIEGLSLPKEPPKGFTGQDLQAVHLGLLIEAAYSGKITSAKRFFNFFLQADHANAGSYISTEDQEIMRLAVQVYSPASVGDRTLDIVKYKSGQAPAIELLLSRLEPALLRKESDAFFALAQAYIRGSGVDKDIEKASKVLTISAHLGNRLAVELRKSIIEKFPRLALSITAEPAVVVANEEATPVKFTRTLEPGETERICLAMMRDEPFCTVLAVSKSTGLEWVGSLPWACHLLYEGSFLKENNTVERCLRLVESLGYPAKAGELCSAPPHVLMDSLLISTYQLGFERGQQAV